MVFRAHKADADQFFGPFTAERAQAVTRKLNRATKGRAYNGYDAPLLTTVPRRLTTAAKGN